MIFMALRSNRKKSKDRTPWRGLFAFTMLIVTQLVLAGSKVTYLHNDHLGRTVMATDASANVVWQVEYKPFGEVEVISGDPSEAKFFGFPGQHFDAESGLYYNYYRDYDPTLGRYLQSDPLGILLNQISPERYLAEDMGIPIPFSEWGLKNSADRAGLPIAASDSLLLNHLYNYTDNNPLNRVDPTGEVWGGVIAGGVVGLGVYITTDCIERCAKDGDCPNDNPQASNKRLADCSNFCVNYLQFLGWNSRGGLLNKGVRAGINAGE